VVRIEDGYSRRIVGNVLEERDVVPDVPRFRPEAVLKPPQLSFFVRIVLARVS
jgi:hypothetical protein